MRGESKQIKEVKGSMKSGNRKMPVAHANASKSEPVAHLKPIWKMDAHDYKSEQLSSARLDASKAQQAAAVCVSPKRNAHF